MRVLALTNLYPPDVLGGFEIAAQQVVDGLIARGHDVQVLAARPRQPLDDSPHVHRRFDLTDEWSPSAMGDHQVMTWLKLARSRVVNAYNVHILTEAIDEFAPDVIYLNNVVGLGGLGLIGCLRALQTPWVWQLGDYIPDVLCSDENDRVAGLAAAFGHEIEGNYIVVSQRVHDVDSRNGLALNGHVELLPYWLTGVRPPPRLRFYRPGAPLRIIAAGRVHHEKGSDLLFRVAARLKAQGFENFNVDFYGRVANPALPDYLLSLGLEGVVTLKGPRPHSEILKLYEEYDLLLFPTWSAEPFGLVPLEAAARGCVPVITDNCGVAEWLVHGVHCLKSARRAEAFANVIRRVIEGEIELQPIASRAAEAAWRDFHLHVILPKIEALLAKVARPSAYSAGTLAETYRLARLAEHLTESLVQENLQALPSATSP